MQSNPDNKNLLLAIVLSVLVMIGWNYFFGVPQVGKTVQQTQSQQNPQSTVPGAVQQAAPTAAAQQQPGALPSAAPVVLKDRAQALAAQPRIAVKTPALSGSISLVGSRFDDISFEKYHDTVNPQSPRVILFSPLTRGGHHKQLHSTF